MMDSPPLYHGTSTEHLSSILRDGILPRSRSGSPGNWGGGWKSKDQFVYLSTSYPVYYASEAISRTNADMVILQVDAKQIGRLYPDDEFVARMLADPNEDGSVEAVLPAVDPSQFNNWKESLTENGTVCCRVVPPEAITRYRILPLDGVLWSWMGGDAVPSPINHQLCGHEYRELIQAFMANGEEAVIELIREKVAAFRTSST